MMDVVRDAIYGGDLDKLVRLYWLMKEMQDLDVGADPVPFRHLDEHMSKRYLVHTFSNTICMPHIGNVSESEFHQSLLDSEYRHNIKGQYSLGLFCWDLYEVLGFYSGRPVYLTKLRVFPDKVEFEFRCANLYSESRECVAKDGHLKCNVLSGSSNVYVNTSVEILNEKYGLNWRIQYV